MNEILWAPSDDRIARTHLRRFMDTAPGGPSTYEELWEWSVSDLPAFWEKVWHDCGIIASQRYERVMGEPRMPGTQWFSGARLNFAENLLRRRDDYPALIGAGEGRDDEVVTYAQLYRLVARARQGLADLEVGEGDRVAALMPNCVETVVLMLATTALGATWSSTSPDFGPMGVVDRFGQIAPRVLVAADGYRYNGTTHRLQDKLREILQRIEGIEQVVTVDFAGTDLEVAGRSTLTYDDLLSNSASEVAFAQLPFDHPLYVLFSSGTTGPPKSIVHGAGGTLVKHLCEHRLHTDLHAGQDVI
ncbi:MAG: AMP-binding protein, partial [Actinomycetota bacterium]|nr:AMP-binding protein [Actinomycetota bacterium]